MSKIVKKAGFIAICIVLLIATGCDPIIQGILDSLTHTVQGANDGVDISLSPLDGADFDATFFANGGELQQGSTITLKKWAIAEVADPINTPHMVSPIIEVTVSPVQVFTAGLYMAVGVEPENGSGVDLAMYYWRAFKGTVQLDDVPDGAETSDYGGIWEEIPGSFYRSFRSIPNPVHELGNSDVDQYLQENDEGGQSGKFVVSDPGPQPQVPADQPWRRRLDDWEKSGWMTPPPAPRGYIYYGSTVVHNSVCVHVEGDLSRDFSSTDLNIINSKTEVVDSAVKDDIIVAHHYYCSP